LAASLVIEQWSGKLVPSRPILFDAEGSRLQKVSGVWALHSVPIFDVPLYTWHPLTGLQVNKPGWMMAMDKPISPQLADAFFAAVRGYVRWGYMGPEPGITNEENELVPISTVCRRVDTFTDRLPDEVCNALCFLTTQKHLKEKLDAERTYASGAQLLLKLIEDRKAQWGEVWAEAQSKSQWHLPTAHAATHRTSPGEELMTRSTRHRPVAASFPFLFEARAPSRKLLALAEEFQ
jgi:hypothetical protein